MKQIIDIFKDSIKVKEALINDQNLILKIEKVVDLCVSSLNNGGKILFCGNGGSAADAQHLAAEFSGRFYKDRAPLFAEALHVNTSYLTAVGNDYGYEFVYSRMIQAKGKKGDILFGISTSGNSLNIINAIKEANERGLTTIGMTGKSGGKMAELSELLLNMPSDDTPRIQEAHITIGHIICQLVEEKLFGV